MERLKKLRRDNDGEYIKKEIEKYINKQGIFQQLTVPYSLLQTGVAKRKNQSFTEMTSCILSEGSLPQRLWMNQS